jgi:hypothetical protein
VKTRAALAAEGFSRVRSGTEGCDGELRGEDGQVWLNLKTEDGPLMFADEH